MWNLSFTPPVVIDARVLTRIPDGMRAAKPTAWADANKGGQAVDSFLEGPCFDRAGNLYVTDIPHGRIFRVSPSLEWTVVAQYDGWPNGLAIHADGSIWIADYRRGILRLDVGSGAIEPVLGHRNSESFKGINDLTFALDGTLYFTDQGQTGLHDPSGRVYRLGTDRRLDVLFGNAASPNGIGVTRDGRTLFVAVTRANALWRAPLLPDGSVSKVGAFQHFFGASGPDSLAMDNNDGVVIAHASLGGAFMVNSRGEITHYVRSPAGQTVTNVAFRPGTSQIVMTESQTGTILEATLPVTGAPLYSHSEPAALPRTQNAR